METSVEPDWAEPRKCRKPSQKEAMGEKVLQSQIREYLHGLRLREKPARGFRDGFVRTTPSAKSIH